MKLTAPQRLRAERLAEIAALRILIRRLEARLAVLDRRREAWLARSLRYGF